MLARCLYSARLRLTLLSHSTRSLSTSDCCKYLYPPARRTFYPIPQVTNLTQLTRHGSEEPAAVLEQGASSMRGGSQERNEEVREVPPSLPAKYNCSGCGAVLQSVNPKRRGFIPSKKLGEWLSLVNDPSKVEEDESGSEYETQTKATEEAGKEEEEEDEEEDIEDFFPETDDSLPSDVHGSSVVSSLICKRCFSLKNYNDALNITLQKDDYLRHLNSLKDKRALIALLLDVTDFPCCVFPDLKNLLSPKSSVLIIANKIDLFPGKLTNRFWSKFKEHVIEECEASGLNRSMIVGVRFVSAKKGVGVLELSQEIIKKWGNRGDVYLLGCTNVGKSSLFNKLLGHLCGSKPGELNTDSNMLAPKATISQWPGTTLGLLSFPLMSVGKRRRLMAQQRAREALDQKQELLGRDDGDEFYKSTKEYDRDDHRENISQEGYQHVEAEDILDELNLRRKKVPIVVEDESPQNRFWLYDTPGAINEAQLINHLTTKELTIALPKAPLRPRTFIMKPGQCLFLGGLARIDYEEGPVTAYFTVFAWPYLNIHATKLRNADEVYKRQLGAPDSIFKLPLEFDEARGSTFPPLEDQKLSIRGAGWKQSVVDVVLSSAGWVAVTVGENIELSLRVHTPGGKGIHVRKPSLFMDAVNQRGTRERYGTRTAYRGPPKKR